MARGRREAPRNKQAVRNSYLYSAANQDVKISDNSEGFVVSRKLKEKKNKKQLRAWKFDFFKKRNFKLFFKLGTILVTSLVGLVFLAKGFSGIVSNLVFDKSEDNDDDVVKKPKTEMVSSENNSHSENTFDLFETSKIFWENGKQLSDFIYKPINNNYSLDEGIEINFDLMPSADSSRTSNVTLDVALSHVEATQSDFNFSELTPEEKVDYLMNEFDLTLEQLQSMLGDMSTQVAKELAPPIQKLSVESSSSPNIIQLDFSEYYRYEGTDEALMQVYNVSPEEWVVICQTLLHEAGPKNGYIEAFAVTTTLINRLAAQHNNIYYMLTYRRQYESYGEGYYKEMGDIYQDIYADSMAGIRDAFYNFAISQKRIHNDYEFRTGGTGKYSRYYTVGGNEYGITKSDSFYTYVEFDLTPLQNLGLTLTP